MTIGNDEIDEMNARAYRRARMAESTEEQIPTALGVWCMIHGAYDCAEPSCWRCGNHKTDGYARCSDPRCGMTNTPAVLEVVASLGEDAPVELVLYEIGRMLSRAGGQTVGSEGIATPSDPTSSE